MSKYHFDEPHVTGGIARITITEEQIVKYSREYHNHFYSDSEAVPEISDEELIVNFTTIHNAVKKP